MPIRKNQPHDLVGTNDEKLLSAKVRINNLIACSSERGCFRSRANFVALVFVPKAAESEIVTAKDAVLLLKADASTFENEAALHSEREITAKKCAQQILRDSIIGQSRGTGGLSTLMVVRIDE